MFPFEPDPVWIREATKHFSGQERKKKIIHNINGHFRFYAHVFPSRTNEESVVKPWRCRLRFQILIIHWYHAACFLNSQITSRRSHEIAQMMSLYFSANTYPVM